MSQVSTAGHGPSKGYGGMNDHLKRYFRKKGSAKQKRDDKRFTRDQSKRKSVK